jgi:hypothetical protein
MINNITKQIIDNSPDISENMKNATKMYLRSCFEYNGDQSKENLWTIDSSILQEKLNRELKGCFNFDFSDIDKLQTIYLSVLTTRGLTYKPVFAKAILNRYLEKTIISSSDGLYKSKGIDISSEASKSINKKSLRY